MLEIRKISSRAWKHTVDSEGITLSKAVCDIKGNDFILSRINGQKPIDTFNVTQITLIDDTTSTTYPTFATGDALAIQLDALDYVGFYRAGDVVAADLISIDPDNIIELGSDGKLFAEDSGGGGGSVTQLITGIKSSESASSSTAFKAQWTTRNLAFSTDNHTRDTWLANATGSQRILFRFGREVKIKKIIILNYFNNTGSENIVTGTGNAGVNNCTIRAVTGDDSLVTASYNADLAETTDMYTGSIPRVFNSKDVFTPVITEITGTSVLIDCDDNHGSPSNIGIRKIWIYGE